MSTEIQLEPMVQPVEDPAVARCCAAWKRAYDNAIARHQSTFNAKDNAATAYKAVMPRLSSPENIRSFITCVTHGMLIEAISYLEAPRLLYAAQVAISAQRAAVKPRKTEAA